jgi:fucose permease
MSTTNDTAVTSQKQGMFVTPDGKSVLFTFVLVSSLFFLWGACNGMIDVMDKHFQEELKLSLSQSAWVQFAHWMGYFLMSIPAGWLATRLGYKGGIIAGLLLVAVGGFWFIPASKIAAFWAFLLGVCVVASGLTFLETVANPYTTVLGPPRYAAARINTAQSCNGVGWILGPIVGSAFFYGTDAAGRSTGSQTLWIPYAGVAIGVLLLSVIFFFAPVPDVKGKDDYDIDDNDNDASAAGAPAVRHVNRPLSYVLLLGNVAALVGMFVFILWRTFNELDLGPRLVELASAIPHPSSLAVSADNSIVVVLAAGACVTLVVAAIALVVITKRLTHHSIWLHEHFTGATLAQFFYVAAQCGIFAFLINYVTSEPPTLPSSWMQEGSKWIEVRTAFANTDFKDVPALARKLTSAADPVSAFLAANLSDSTRQTLARLNKGDASVTVGRVALTQDLNSLIVKQSVYDPQRFSGIPLTEKTKELLAESKGRSEARLNRLLLADAYPQELAFQDGIVGATNQLAAMLASVGFFCFFLGRVTGAALLRKVSAHKMLGLYSVINAALCLLVFLKLGWFSVVSVFLCYFFMSITFPTIFALGIFGLGARAKRASAYIVMSIVGGALLPPLMGVVAERSNMSRGFIVPVVCFVLIALYGYGWPKLSQAESLHGVGSSGGH